MVLQASESSLLYNRLQTHVEGVLHVAFIMSAVHRPGYRRAMAAKQA